MYYMGIDASTTSTGIGIFKDKELIAYDNIKPKSTDWCKRVGILGKRLNEIFQKYPQIEECYIEDVPMKDGKITITKLGACRGAVAVACEMNNVTLIPRKVNEWRQDANFFDGTKEGMKRDKMKEKAINEVKRLFDIDVNDDIAEGILIGYYSKYPIDKKVFGRR